MKKIYFTTLLFILCFSCFSQDNTNKAKRKFINRTPGYSKSVSITANGITTVYISGLTGEGNTFEEQTRNAFKNILTELKANNTTLSQIVKMNTYIVNINPQNVDTFRTVRKEIFGIKNINTENDGMPASTIIGISALAEKGKLIEIEAVVVLEATKPGNN